MKRIQNTGLILFLMGLFFFISLLFVGSYKLTPDQFNDLVVSKGIKSEVLISRFQNDIIGKEFNSARRFSSQIISALNEANGIHKKERTWNKVIWTKPRSFAYDLAKSSGYGAVATNKGLFWLLTFGLGILGSLLFIIPNIILLGPPGIKNNGIWHSTATNRGWIEIKKDVKAH